MILFRYNHFFVSLIDCFSSDSVSTTNTISCFSTSYNRYNDVKGKHKLILRNKPFLSCTGL